MIQSRDKFILQCYIHMHWYVIIWKWTVMLGKIVLLKYCPQLVAWQEPGRLRDWILDLPFPSIYNMYWLQHYLWSPASSLAFMKLLICGLGWTIPTSQNYCQDVLRNIINFCIIVHNKFLLILSFLFSLSLEILTFES